MKKLFFAFVLLSQFSATAQAQNAAPPKNAIYLTLGGDALLSAQYGRVFYEKDKFSLDAKIGAGATFAIGLGGFLGSGGLTSRSISHSVSANFGVRHCLETGVAGIYRYQAHPNDDVLKNGYGVYPVIGYKYRPERSGFTFRFFTQPMTAKGWRNWTLGVSAGFAF